MRELVNAVSDNHMIRTTAVRLYVWRQKLAYTLMCCNCKIQRTYGFGGCSTGTLLDLHPKCSSLNLCKRYAEEPSPPTSSIAYLKY